MRQKKKRSEPKAQPQLPVDRAGNIEVGAGVFKDKCLALMDKVRNERVQIIITKHGNAVARLVPADVAVPDGFGFMRGTVIKQGDIVSPDFEAWGDV